MKIFLHASNLKKTEYTTHKHKTICHDTKPQTLRFSLAFCTCVCFTPLKLEFLRDFLHSHTHYHPEHLLMVFGAVYGGGVGDGGGYGGGGGKDDNGVYHWHWHYHTPPTHLSFTRSLCIIQSLLFSHCFTQSDRKTAKQERAREVS